MPTTKDHFRVELEKLVHKFQANLAEYMSPSYTEAQVRHQFIDPFFTALGWDFEDKAGLGPNRCEVWTEKGETSGKPDYNFRIDGQTKFFAEAKAPHVTLSTKQIIQSKKYAWNTQAVSFAVLTDFEGIRLYDAREKPDEKHADRGRVFEYRFDQYLTEKALDGIWMLSRDEVAAGSLDRLIRGRPPKNPLDKAFLADLTGWRTELAKDAYKNVPGLGVQELNEAVQVFLDRLIFVQIAQDRHIMEAGGLKTLLEQWREGKHRSLRAMLDRIFEQVNEDLNGEIFKPNESLRKAVFTDSLVAKILRELCDGPYDFSVIGVELLGSIYERYLGKTIRVTPAQVRVEDKPEVRKAGGVYYTPKYIVDYIVENTVGKLIEGKTPRQIAKLRILDPACGSGSFLLGAYQKLIDYHVAWYTEHPKEARGCSSKERGDYKGDLFPCLVEEENGRKRLSILEKGRILTNNIYGVDIDAQAVEITMMSLYIKALEGETSLPRKQALLPALKNNIKCGNSLIAPDYFTGKPITDPDTLTRVNPFDWAQEFPDAMKAGGFDCVIGNPPYIRIQTMKEWAPLEVGIYKELYKVARQGNYDIYVVFLERGLELLNPKGRLGFICPHKFFNAKYGRPLRSVVADGQHLAHVVHFGDQQVFDGATTYTCLLFLDKSPVKKFRLVKVADLAAWRASGTGTEGVIKAKRVTADEWNFAVGGGAALFERLAKMPVRLGDVTNRICQGPITSADTVFLFERFRAGGKGTTKVMSAELDETVLLESSILKRVIRSGSIGRYHAMPTALVLFPYEVKDCEARLYTPDEMQDRFPLAWKYLNRNRDTLADREKGNFRDGRWYRFGRTQNLGMWEQSKLMIPYMITNLAAYFDLADNFYFINVTTGGYGITSDHRTTSLEYLCALLNSRLLDFYLKEITTTFHGGYYAANKQFIETLPIRPIDFAREKDKALHGRIVRLVDSMLGLHKQRAAAKSDAQKAVIHRQIDTTDAEINRLVYELYGLAKEEIAIVEGRDR